ncbi:MAG TPA: winged helix-turn-helix domain-containing protein, partial [Tahibacter sp.]|nr:winged helix-turn-helix domain-containing protein [Tahibacter sp.]
MQPSPLAWIERQRRADRRRDRRVDRCATHAPGRCRRRSGFSNRLEMAGEHYEFAGFRLLVATRELRRPDGSTTLMPARIFDCVLYLIEHRARAIGRDELIAAVWNQPEVGDNVLAQLLARTRKLLNDDGGEQRVIRTVPGFGYHWVAATQVNEAPAPPRTATA